MRTFTSLSAIGLSLWLMTPGAGAAVGTAPGGGGGGGVASATNAVNSINSDTTLAQNIVTGSSGTDVGVSTASGTHTIALPSASATVRGVLSSNDWALFVSKQQSNGMLTVLTTMYITGTGSPETVVSARVGAFYSCTNTCSGSTLWLKTNGTAATGWWQVQDTTGGGAGVSDGDKTDVVISGGGSTFTVEGHSGPFVGTGPYTNSAGIILDGYNFISRFGDEEVIQGALYGGLYFTMDPFKLSWQGNVIANLSTNTSTISSNWTVGGTNTALQARITGPATNSILRTGAGGAVVPVTIGSGLSLSAAGTLSATGGGSVDVTASTLVVTNSFARGVTNATATTASIDWAGPGLFRYAPAGTFTLSFVNTPSAGSHWREIEMELLTQQSGTFPSGIDWGLDGAAFISAGATNYYRFRWNGTNVLGFNRDGPRTGSGANVFSNAPAIYGPALMGNVTAGTIDVRTNVNFLAGTVTNRLTVLGALETSMVTNAYGATVAIDVDTNRVQKLTLTGHVTLSTANRSANKARLVMVAITASGADRHVTNSASWTVSGTNAAYFTVPSGKTALLSLLSVGSAETDVIAEYEVCQ